MDLFMSILINALLFLFTLLIFIQVYQIHQVKEGLDPGQSTSTYQPYDPNNPTILAQQNAGNIQVLKEQLDELKGIKGEVEDISKNLYTLTDQVNQYMVQQGTNAQSQLPSTPPTFTGVDEEDTPTP